MPSAWAAYESASADPHQRTPAYERYCEVLADPSVVATEQMKNGIESDRRVEGESRAPKKEREARDPTLIFVVGRADLLIENRFFN